MGKSFTSDILSNQFVQTAVLINTAQPYWHHTIVVAEWTEDWSALININKHTTTTIYGLSDFVKPSRVIS